MPFFAARKPPLEPESALPISFRRHDIPSEPRIFGLSNTVVANSLRISHQQRPRCSLLESPRFSMAEEEIPSSKLDEFALAIAHGQSINAWALQNEVPRPPPSALLVGRYHPAG